MGKRKAGGMSGLSRFVAAFDTASAQPVSHSRAAITITSETTALNTTTDDAVDKEQTSYVTDEKSPSQQAILVKDSNIHTLTDDELQRRYDATGLVPFFKDISEVPEHLKKYFAQRTRFFSLYHSPPGCLLEEEGWYSVTPERIADQIAERCRCDVILDPFCGVGGNVIAFAKTCERVIALDTNATRLALARHNAQIYGVADRIEFIQADYLTFAESYTSSSLFPAGRRKIDVVFLSPPWGGPAYLDGSPSNTAQHPSSLAMEADPHPKYSLASIQPIHGKDLFNLTRQITPNVAYYLPRNTDLAEISELLTGDLCLPGERIEVEEEWMGNKLKAITCYFGGLAEGQAELF